MSATGAKQAKRFCPLPPVGPVQDPMPPPSSRGELVHQGLLRPRCLARQKCRCPRKAAGFPESKVPCCASSLALSTTSPCPTDTLAGAVPARAIAKLCHPGLACRTASSTIRPGFSTTCKISALHALIYTTYRPTICRCLGLFRVGPDPFEPQRASRGPRPRLQSSPIKTAGIGPAHRRDQRRRGVM